MKQLFTITSLILCLSVNWIWAQTDAGVTALLTTPPLQCNVFSTGIQVQIQYQNLGTTSISSTPVGYSIPGQAPVLETGVATLPPGGVANYTFMIPLVLPNPSTLYNLKIWTSQPGDNNAANDTFLITIPSPPKVNLPYTENFETFTPGDVAAPFGLPGVLTNGWDRSSFTTSEGWFVSDQPTQTGGTGPDLDHTPNGNTFLFMESSGGANGTTHSLTSPCIDLAGSVVPRLSFWYHMFGNTMGTLQVRIIQNGISTSAWTVTGQQQTSGTDQWLEGVVDLTPYAGSIIQLEFIGTKGTGILSDIGLDDISIYDPDPVDAGLAGIVAPIGPGCYTNNEEIIVTVQNFGSQPLDLSLNPVTVNLGIFGPTNGAFTVTLNSGVIPLLGSQDVSVTTTADLSLPGIYNIGAVTVTPGDVTMFNDSLLSTIETLPTLSGPLKEDFELFPLGGPGFSFGGWTTRSDNNEGWTVRTLGTPTFGTGPSGNNTPTGTQYVFSEQSIFSGSPQPGEKHELISPCLDVSTMSNPKLSFFYHMFGAQIGELQVYILTGDTTQLVFNQVGQVQTASTDPWDSTVIDLAPFQNASFQIVFTTLRGTGSQGDIAIDDINIFDPPAIDVFTSRLVSPAQQCAYTASETVTVEIINFGSDTLTNITAQFAVDGGVFGPIENVAGPVAPGDTVFHTFTGTADLSAPGPHNITVVATQTTPPDASNANDTLDVNYTNLRTAVNTFPYFEDFENGKGDWESIGLIDPWQFGRPSAFVINAAASGDSAWVTNLTGNYIANADGFVVGPCFDFSALTRPVIRLDINYVSETIYDGAVLQYSIDGGLNWFNVGNLNDPINWYNNTLTGFNASRPGGSAVAWAGVGTQSSNGWITAEHELDGLGGFSSVLLRVAFGSDAFASFEGFAFDNVEIFQKPAFDAEAIVLDEPGSGCDLSDSTTVALTFTNAGTSPITTMDLSYQINGGPIVTETANFNLAFGQTTTYSFTQTADLSVPGQYTIVAWTERSGDILNDNDTVRNTVTSVPLVNTFPYLEDFSTGPGGWVAGGTNSTWVLGEPNKAVIQGAASDSNCWVNGGLTGTYQNNAQSFVLGPCFDFTSLTAPIVRLSLWISCENNFDGAVLQSSVNDGLTWQRVGNAGDPVNWYNDNFISSNPGGQAQGWTGQGPAAGWITAQHDLTGLAGQPSVRLRIAFSSDFIDVEDGVAFDDFSIFDRATNDLAGVEFVNLERNFCDNDSTPIQVRIANSGLAPQTNTPVRVLIEGPGGTTLNGSLPGTANPGDTLTVVLGNFGSMLPGIYRIKGFAILPSDTLAFNDTAYATFEIIETPPDPTVVSDSVCATNGSNFTLLANTTAQTVTWYDAPVGGNIVNDGPVFNTPFLTSSQTFYAEASNATCTNVGPPNNNFGNGSFVNFNAGLDFTAFTQFTLKEVRVFPSTPGTVQIEIRNQATNAVIYTSPLFVIPPGIVDTSLTLDADIPPGNYEILRTNATSASLYRNFSGPSYPYTLPGVVSIFQASNNSANFYYFFYDWVVGNRGCTSGRVPVNAVLLPPASVDLGRDGIQCVGYELDASADPGITSWEWFVNGDTTVIASASRYNVDSSGVYEVFVENAAGCTDRDTIVLQIIPKPEINAGTDTSGCDAIVLTADTIAGATYFWFGPNAGSQDPTRQSYSADLSGNYLLTINAGGCTNTDTVNVNILPAPTINLGRDKATCDSTVLDAGAGAASYLWSNGDTTQTTTVPPPMPGMISTYAVTVSNTLGCANGDTIELRLGNPPVVNLGPDRSGCDQLTLFSGVGSADYLWNTGATTQSITVNQSGTYAVTVTDVDGCSDTDSVDVVLDFTPTAAATYGFGLTSYDVIFSNTTTPANATYTWNFGDGSPISTDPNPIHKYGFPGVFRVQMIATNSCGSDTAILLVGGVSNDPSILDQQLTVRPNPTTDWITVEIADLHAEELTVELTDLRGKQLFYDVKQDMHGAYTQRLDLRQFAEGVYVLRINDGVREVRRRIIRK